MTDTKQTQPIQFQLKLVSVKMKIKFPCKMALEYHKQQITKEVPWEDGNKFVFNEDLTLKGQGESQSYDIFANLYTQKGTKYTSGVMKLLGAELVRSQGQRIIVPLTKCLDADAFCDIKVEQVNSGSRLSPRMSRNSSKILNGGEQTFGELKQLKKIVSDKNLIGQTKSQIHSPPSPKHLLDDIRLRENTKTQIIKSFVRSPGKHSNIKYLSAGYQGFNGGKNMSQFPGEQVITQRPTLIQADVIRQSYQKLKLKYKKEAQLSKEEAHKRMLLQANQNNYKLEIIKYKLKCQSLEKEVSDKNQKMRLINAQLADLQKKDIDIAYIKEQNLALETKVKIYDETIQALTKDNQTIKKLLSEKSKNNEQAISTLRGQLEFANSKFEEVKYELELQGQTKDAIIEGKNNDIKLRSQTIERQKKLIKDLEDQAQQKLFQFEKTLSSERNSSQSKISEFKVKVETSEKEKEILKSQINQLNEDAQKQNHAYHLLEYNKKMLSEQIEILNKEIGDFKVMKQKYSELQKDYRLLDEQFTSIRRQLELSLQNKEINIKEIMNKYGETKDKNQKIKTEYDQKIKQWIIKAHEHELIIQTLRNSCEKYQRNNDHLQKDITNLKKLSSNLREELTKAEKRIIRLESQSSTYSSRFERETANLKFLIDKYKEEKENIEKQADLFKDKIQKLQQKKGDMERKEQEWLIKTRHFQQKIEKDANKHKQNLNKSEAIVRQHENTIAELTSQIQGHRSQLKEYRQKMNQNDLKDIKNKEKQERFQKDIKINEQKINSLQNQLKSRTNDLQTETEKNRQQQSKLLENELSMTKMKEQIIQQQHKTSKQLQIAELLNKDIIKLNRQIEELQKVITNKENTEEDLRHQLKLTKEENVEEKIKLKRKNNQFEKFKEAINDIIKIQFVKILKAPKGIHKTEKLRQSQVSRVSSRSDRSRVKQSLDAAYISSSLAQKLHETKTNLWKMAELNRAFREQNNKMMEQFQSETNKHEFTKLQLHRDIQLLEDEMNEMLNDKESQNCNYDNLVVELNAKIKEKEIAIDELRAEMEDYTSVIEGFKSDFQTNNDLNEKKVNTLRSNIAELNQRIDYLNLNVACLEDKNHELEQKHHQMESQVIEQKQLLIKYEKKLVDSKENEERSLKEFQSIKKQYKSLLEIKAEIQIQFNSEKQIKEKYITMLEEEEKKTNKQNEFITELIVQKQNAIKNALERSEQVNNLQNKIFELTQQNELLKEQNQLFKKKNEQYKEQIKVVNKSIKTVEKQLSEEKTKSSRNLQKLKEKQNDINIKKDYIKDLEEQYRILRDKNYQQIKQLNNELEDKNSLSASTSKELTQKIIKLESQNKKLWEDSFAFKSQIQNLNQQIYEKIDHIENLNIEIKKIQEERNSSLDELVSKQFLLHQRVDEIQKLQEIIDEQKTNFLSLKNQFQQSRKQYDLGLNDLINEYTFKMDSITREYEEKIELKSKQSDFILDKYKPLEDQLNKVLLEKKSQEIEHEQTKKMYEEKIRKIENQRLANILQKNNQIKKLSEQSKTNLTKLHQKESQFRKVSLDYEQLRLSTGRNQQYYSYNLEQSKNKEKVLGKQIEGLKVNYQHIINYKQNLLNYLYQNQVEVRKILASMTKKILQTCNQNDMQKMKVLLKGVQNNVVGAMMTKIENS